ncbi:MAG: hypothetical protein K6A23_06470 [Butyrivibrio sp.]|nr:hypothetical protein [Butyrivibrio sp.]
MVMKKAQNNILEKYNTIYNTLENLEQNLLEDTRPVYEFLTAEGVKVKEVPYGLRSVTLEDASSWDNFSQEEVWGKSDTHYCFALTLDIPDIYKGKEVVFFLSTGAEDIWNTNNPQMLVYVNGKRRCGMDINHDSLVIYEKTDWEAQKDRHIDIRIYAYSNLGEGQNLLKMSIAARNEAVQKLYFDMLVPFEAAKAMLGIPESKKESVLDTTAGAVEESDKNPNITNELFQNVPDKYKEPLGVIMDNLATACNILNDDQANGNEYKIVFHNADKASDYLRSNLYGTGPVPGIVNTVGHTHIDVAWKWQLRQTREKVVRSYSTVMELMNRYPDYIFMASTPQLYEFVKQEEPELFDEIKNRVREGRFEPEGAMWLEADCNLTSGESLVRQILYGKEYFQKEFGIDSKVLWLPDVFGYSAAMPQILKKSGIRTFMTTKLAWNDTNRMPYDLFKWEGIDGSRITTYIVTTCDEDKARDAAETGSTLNYTYNGKHTASQIMGTWTAFREKNITDNVLTCMGHGDGGGGPTWQMLEMDRRFRMGIPGVPKTQQTRVADFFAQLQQIVKDYRRVPVWNGELYLEFHRGTYTSIGKNKRNNRHAEYLLQAAEVLSVCSFLQKGTKYPAAKLNEIWKTVLLNQFHDILPGSSIEQVYQDSDKQYAEIERKAEDIIDKAKKKLDIGKLFDTCAGEDLNSESILNAKICKRQGKGIHRSGKIKLSSKKDNLYISNNFYNIIFDSNAEIISLFDKEAGYEVRPENAHPLNRLIAFEDKPKQYDCWNIDADFENVSWDITDCREFSYKIYEEPEDADADDKTQQKVVITIKRNFRESEICQNIIIYANSRRIDFETKVDWHEHQILLKAAFPVNIDSDVINCEIQYGNITRNLTRNNSWDKAKFECCAHKWIDISQNAEKTENADKSENTKKIEDSLKFKNAEISGTHGVALLNDCKYGYDAKEKLMRLTLIKSGIFPNPNADQGLHEFTYSLYPHMGDFKSGEVIENARKLNEEKHLFEGFSDYVKAIIDFGEERGIYTEAIKLSEDGDKEIIIRMYEGHGLEHNVKAALLKGFTTLVQEVYECDLLENRISSQEVPYNKGKKEISLQFKPYEIKTLCVHLDL